MGGEGMTEVLAGRPLYQAGPRHRPKHRLKEYGFVYKVSNGHARIYHRFSHLVICRIYITGNLLLDIP
jgi:hypothetical protein